MNLYIYFFRRIFWLPNIQTCLSLNLTLCGRQKRYIHVSCVFDWAMVKKTGSMLNLMLILTWVIIIVWATTTNQTTNYVKILHITVSNDKSSFGSPFLFPEFIILILSAVLRRLFFPV